MADAVQYQTSGPVATITLARPESRNALSPAVLAGLHASLGAAIADANIRAAVITNTGPVFCAGADLAGGGGVAGGENPGLPEVLAAIQDAPKPVIARIAGHAFGGGVGLAAACDLSVAANSSRFGFTEVRVGVAPAIISVFCLPKLSRGEALELFLTGERFDANRAAASGLINLAVPDDALDQTINGLVQRILLGSPAAVAAAKRLVYTVPQLPRDEALAVTATLSQQLFASPEGQEGMAAFRERRIPSWVAGESTTRGS